MQKISQIFRVTLITFRRLARGLRIPGKRPEALLFLAAAGVTSAAFWAGSQTPAWIVSFFAEKPFSAFHYLFAASAIVCFNQPPQAVIGLTSGLYPAKKAVVLFGPRSLAFLFQSLVTISFLASLMSHAGPEISLPRSFSLVALSTFTGFAGGTLAIKTAAWVAGRAFSGSAARMLPSASLIIVIAYVLAISRLPFDLDETLSSQGIDTALIGSGLSLLLGVGLIFRFRSEDPREADSVQIGFGRLFAPLALSVTVLRCRRNHELLSGLIGAVFSLILLSGLSAAWQIDTEILVLPFAVISSRMQWIMLTKLKPTTGAKLLCGARTDHGFLAAAGFGLLLMIFVVGIGGLALAGTSGPGVLVRLLTLSAVCWVAVLMFYTLTLLWGWRPGDGSALMAAGLACVLLGQTVAGLDDGAVIVRLLAYTLLSLFLYLILIRFALTAIERRLVNDTFSES